MEEERRLCYVGITRAKEKLSLSCATSRFRNGEQQYNPPSRFLAEIPRYLIKQSASQSKFSYYKLPEEDKKVSRGSSLWTPYTEKSAKAQSQKNTGSTGKLFAGNPLITKGFSSYQTPGTKAGSKKSSIQGNGTPGYKEGDRVTHSKFGEGTVKTLNAKAGDFEVCVDFDSGCTRKMMASFAKLKKI